MRQGAGLVAAVIVFLVLAPGVARAQTGSIEVRVVDGRDGSPLAGATATLTSDRGLIAPTSTIADAEGWAHFPVLRVGSGYSLAIAFPGFATHSLPGLRVGVGQALRFAVSLSTEIRERVQVTATRDVVDIERSEKASRFDAEFMESLPIVGRFYQGMLTLAPGVNDSDGDGNPNVHGARSRNFKAVVGGISNTDPLSGEWLSRINSESIETIEIVTAGAGVEEGRASGGFARVLQKQGSNDFEGVFSAIYSTSKLDGAGVSSPATGEVPDFDRFQPVLQVSGPIVRDRLWYRLSHEYVDREDPIVFSDRIDVIGLTEGVNDDQLTWQVSPRNKLAFQVQSDRLAVDNFGMSARLRAESSQRLERGGTTYKLTWTAPVSARVLVDSQVAYQDHYKNLLPQQKGVFNGCVSFGLFDSAFGALNDSSCTNTLTGFTGGTYPETSRDRRQRLTLRTLATLYQDRLFGGSHRLKLGMEVESERYFRELQRRPSITFFIGENPANPIPTSSGLEELGFAATRVAAPSSSSGRVLGGNWSVYAEDQFKPAAGLALTLGVRYDREEIRSIGQRPFDPQAEARDYLARIADNSTPDIAAQAAFTGFAAIDEFQRQLAQSLNVRTDQVQLGSAALRSAQSLKKRVAEDVSLTRNNVSPRLAVAWDPWNNGRTKLSMTAGRYYDKIVLAVPLIEVEPPEALLVFEAQPFQETFIDTELIPFGPSISTRTVDRGLRTPYQDEFTAGFERALWPETSLKLSFIRRRFRDQLQDVDINHLPGDLGRCVIPSFFGDPVVTASEGSGRLIIDPYTREAYTDSDPGPGDGRMDDCTGDVTVAREGPVVTITEIPDGLTDLYVQNPSWGEILLVGNFNETEYKAYVLEIVRRMYRGWQLNGSYTWSKAIGNAEDFTQILGNELNLTEDEKGLLDFDQRHSVKISAMTITPWGVRLGGTLRWESGLPYSALVTKQTVFGRPPLLLNLADPDRKFRLRYPSRRRNDLSNPSFWTLDLRLAREFTVGRTQLQATAEVFNVFADDTLRLDDRINGLNAGTRRFGRQYQIGLRVGF